MTYKILNQYNLINGTTDSSYGPINPYGNGGSERVILKFLKNLGIKNYTKNNLIFAEQVHGPGIYKCKKDDGGKIIKGVDALITSYKEQVLVVKTADCVPILIYDPQKEVVTAIHAGRRSLTSGIIRRTIKELIKSYGILPKNLIVAIGPHIRVHDYFLKPGALRSLTGTSWEKYFVENQGQVFFDLTKATLDQLIKMGIREENIKDCKICTFCNYKKYYSARKKEQNPAIYQEKFPCFGSIIGMRK